MNVVSFSGGKDSTAMLLMMIERGIKIDRIVCVDTTKEFPAMYEHIKQVQAYIQPLQIDILSFDFDYWHGEHVKVKGKHIGKVGYGFVDHRNRWCTTKKQQAIKKYLKEFANVTEYHGIALDEVSRTKKNQDGRNIKYPLVEWGITEKEALKYCYSKGFSWDGLYGKFHRVSCWCCPLQRIGEARTLYNDFPGLWKELQEMQKKSYRKFMKNYTVDELGERFEDENRRLGL